MVFPCSVFTCLLTFISSYFCLPQVGATIHEKLIPHAVRWYTGEAIEDEPPFDFDGYGEDDEDEDEEG